MTITFSLAIELGNEAMQDSEDVAHALRKVADRVADIYGPLNGDETGKVFDVNGNSVGSWAVR